MKTTIAATSHDPSQAAAPQPRAYPGRPVRPAPPGSARAPGPQRSAGQVRPPRPARQARDSAGKAPSRTPFIAVVLGLLGGGLVCLLVINTTLAAASFRISALQQSNAETAQRVQQLQQQVATEASPASIEQRAFRLGMRIQPALSFIDLRTGRTYTTPPRAPGARAIPGYTP